MATFRKGVRAGGLWGGGGSGRPHGPGECGHRFSLALKKGRRTRPPRYTSRQRVPDAARAPRWALGALAVRADRWV
jgi:hypothetical protein